MPGRRQACLVTGVNGCVGAWVAKALLADGVTVVGLDAGLNHSRLRLALGEDPVATPGLTLVQGDIVDADLVADVFAEFRVGSVIHLAALQVPAVAADPVAGARVNVVGTTVIMEAARKADLTAPVVFASSVAAHDAVEGSSADHGNSPSTLYGVFKRANEGAASVYWADHSISSIGIRPAVVYGPGRDQGLTSAPTAAMLAAARGESYHIEYGGRTQMQYVEDVAAAFIQASRSEFRGTAIGDIGGPSVTMADVVDSILLTTPEAAGRITWTERQLPFPSELTDHGLPFRQQAPTSLVDGVAKTMRTFGLHSDTEPVEGRSE